MKSDWEDKSVENNIEEWYWLQGDFSRADFGCGSLQYPESLTNADGLEA